MPEDQTQHEIQRNIKIFDINSYNMVEVKKRSTRSKSSKYFKQFKPSDSAHIKSVKFKTQRLKKQMLKNQVGQKAVTMSKRRHLSSVIEPQSCIKKDENL